MQFATDHQPEPVGLTLHGFGRSSAGLASSANLKGLGHDAADQPEVGHSACGRRGGSIPIEYCHAGPER
jgi:hypothetical protein